MLVGGFVIEKNGGEDPPRRSLKRAILTYSHVYAIFSDRSGIAGPGFLPLGHRTMDRFCISVPTSGQDDLLPVVFWRQKTKKF